MGNFGKVRELLEAKLRMADALKLEEGCAEPPRATVAMYSSLLAERRVAALEGLPVPGRLGPKNAGILMPICRRNLFSESDVSVR